jgi:hypothetical protein
LSSVRPSKSDIYFLSEKLFSSLTFIAALLVKVFGGTFFGTVVAVVTGSQGRTAAGRVIVGRLRRIGTAVGFSGLHTPTFSNE